MPPTRMLGSGLLPGILKISIEQDRKHLYIPAVYHFLIHKIQVNLAFQLIMKRFLTGYLALLAVLIASCTNSSEDHAKQLGNEIWFPEEIHDYGEIRENSNGSYTFKFKNISDLPIVVNRVRSNCGCTVPSWPREPVEPGDEGEIVVRYNTELTGSFMKSIYVYSSAANSPVKLQIKGKVIPINISEDAEDIE